MGFLAWLYVPKIRSLFAGVKEMTARLNIEGERYGRLVAVSRVEPKARRSRWLFQCDCGNTKEIGLEGVRDGRVQSCGCLQREKTAERSTTHGHSAGYERSAELRAWYHAKGRCFNPNDAKFLVYGGRGISMCGKWAASFAAFYADMGPRPAGTTIDRMDPDKGYEPGNCRWATPVEQARTRTDNVFVEHQGKRMILKDFAASVGAPYKRLSFLMKKRGIDAVAAAEYILKKPLTP